MVARAIPSPEMRQQAVYLGNVGLTLDNPLICAFSLGLEDRMTLDLVEAHVRPGASSPDPSIVIADIPRGIGQGQLAASGMLARIGAIGGTSVSPHACRLRTAFVPRRLSYACRRPKLFTGAGGQSWERG